MLRLAFVVAVLGLAVPFTDAGAQSLDARRTAMGGVVLSAGGPGHDASNVAYRAVPGTADWSARLPLPIGFVPLLTDPPVLDPDDPDFDVYALADLVYNPPWNLQLTTPSSPDGDIVVRMSRDQLSVELGEVAAMFPERESRLSGAYRLPTLGLGFRGLFAGVSAIATYDNRLGFNDRLHGVLTRGEAFTARNHYELQDDVRGQAAASMELGYATGVMRPSDRRTDRSGLYVGGRARMLRGLAYGEAASVAWFDTGDTLFGSQPIELEYQAMLRDAGPGDGGWGGSFDLGAVWIAGDLELGIGVNDIASHIDWRARESVARHDPAGGDITQLVLAEQAPFTTWIPTTTTVTAARRFGTLLVAADLVHDMSDVTGHLGAEQWLGMFAVRGGAGVDAEQRVQFGGGCGIRIGRVGADLAVATHQRTLSGERGLELGAGLSLYR